MASEDGPPPHAHATKGPLPPVAMAASGFTVEVAGGVKTDGAGVVVAGPPLTATLPVTGAGAGASGAASGFPRPPRPA